jgi:hypothetical protein
MFAEENEQLPPNAYASAEMSKESLGIYVQSRDSGHDIVSDMKSDGTERYDILEWSRSL